MKTSELTGVALDWAVQQCEGTDALWWEYSPSQKWEQGGPIIERERLSLTPRDGFWECFVHDQLFADDGSDHHSKGPTPLIAAMRCYVASKLGAEIDLPKELT